MPLRNGAQAGLEPAACESQVCCAANKATESCKTQYSLNADNVKNTAVDHLF